MVSNYIDPSSEMHVPIIKLQPLQGKHGKCQKKNINNSLMISLGLQRFSPSQPVSLSILKGNEQMQLIHYHFDRNKVELDISVS